MMAQTVLGDFERHSVQTKPMIMSSFIQSSKGSSVCTGLVSSSPHVLMGKAKITSIDTGLAFPSQGFTIEEAQQFAIYIVDQLPSGYQFTLLGLFGNLCMKGSNRSRTMMINALRKRSMIICAGITQKDQEKRHRGFASLWEVV